MARDGIPDACRHDPNENNELRYLLSLVRGGKRCQKATGTNYSFHGDLSVAGNMNDKKQMSLSSKLFPGLTLPAGEFYQAINEF